MYSLLNLGNPYKHEVADPTGSNKEFISNIEFIHNKTGYPLDYPLDQHWLIYH